MKPIALHEIASPHVITLRDHDCLLDAVRTITTHRIHNILIDKEDGSYTVLGLSDILQNTAQEGWQKLTLALLPQKPLKMISHDATLIEASVKLEYGDEVLGIVNGAGQLESVVTHKDIADATNISDKEMSNISVHSIVMKNSTATALYGEMLQDTLSKLTASPTDSLIILKDEKPVGIITKRDIIRFLHDGKALNGPVEAYMSTPLFTVQSDISISSALITMQNKHYRRAVTLDRDGYLQGVIQQKTIISILYNFTVKELLDSSQELRQILNKEVAFRTQELESHKQSLEALVKERTKRLEETNAALKQEIAAREQMQEVMRRLVQSTSACVGEDFFRKLVQHLSETLGMRYTLIGKLSNADADSITTLAMFSGTDIVDNITYKLHGTPCENVVGKKLCSYPQEIQSLFPEDRILVDINAHSYVGTPLFDSKGAALGILAVMDDQPLSDEKVKFTEAILHIFASRASAELERMQTEQILQEYKHKLEKKVQLEIRKRLTNEKIMLQQSKFAAMGEMVSMIAHQWRQPLSAIASALAVLQVKSELGILSTELLKQKVVDMNRYLQYMSGTIDDFRNFYKSGNESESALLSKTMKTSLGIIEANLSFDNITVEKAYEELEPIETYHNELMQVFLSILKNAQDALIANAVKNPLIRISISKSGDTLQRVSIFDNAGGIPEALLERIFEPYFSTKEQLNGTGLGLYMSKTIIEEHCKGRLSVRNRDGGAEFIIELPVQR